VGTNSVKKQTLQSASSCSEGNRFAPASDPHCNGRTRYHNQVVAGLHDSCKVETQSLCPINVTNRRERECYLLRDLATGCGLTSQLPSEAASSEIAPSRTIVGDSSKARGIFLLPHPVFWETRRVFGVRRLVPCDTLLDCTNVSFLPSWRTRKAYVPNTSRPRDHLQRKAGL
jgi:hypothetical protein